MNIRFRYLPAAVAALVLALAGCVAASAGVTATPAATPETEIAPTQEPATAAGRTVSAGMQTDFFNPYTVVVLPDWKDSHASEPAAPFDALTLTKGDYNMLIGQGGGDGLMCLFGGAPTPDGAAHLWLEFETGVPIANPSVDLMRATSDGVTHTICEKSGDGYITWTSFGSIMYTTPSPADEATLAEMDAMVATLALAK